MASSGKHKPRSLLLKISWPAACLAALLFIICWTPLSSPAAEQPVEAEEVREIDTSEPLGIFIFASARFKRGELDEYFDEMEGDFFSREQDTLTGAMQSLLHYTLERGADFNAVDPVSYRRMNKAARVEIFRTQKKVATAEKFDKAALEKYSILLDFRYVLIGDLLKIKTWDMEELAKGCEMEMAFLVYDADEREFIRDEKFSINAKVPAGARIPRRRLRTLDSNAASLARSPHGYCFLDIAGQLIDSLLPEEETEEELLEEEEDLAEETEE